MLKADVLVFDGFNELDAIGRYEVVGMFDAAATSVIARNQSSGLRPGWDRPPLRRSVVIGARRPACALSTGS
jgi:hypothetical protein